MHFLDEVAQHALGGIEVGDHAILQRANRHDVARRSADHALCFGTHGQDATRGAVDRDHRRFIEHDATTAHIDQGVGGSQVDGHVTPHK